MRPVLFALDEPQYHTIRFGESHRFRGAALALDGNPIVHVSLHRNGVRIAEAPVALPCPELAFLSVQHAASSRFLLKAPLDGNGALEVRGERENGRDEPLFALDLDFARREAARMAELTSFVRRLPLPDGALVSVTQGGEDARAYGESIVSGLLTTEAMLTHAGIDPAGIQSVLDLGCGTGRLLAGWAASGRDRASLVGADINAALIGWATQHLSGLASWQVSTPLPPLDVPADSADLALVVSVFTHLPLEWQRAWLDELWRVLRPGGSVLISLHGEVYARLLLDGDRSAEYALSGYTEVWGAEEGANAFGSFHAPAFARELFGRFRIRAAFPMGAIPGEVPSWFPVAAWQDVYILEK
jgi:SAM-dependent methyltransferase